MSWDYAKKKATCEKCGKEGFYFHGSNDWMQTTSWWEGFNQTSVSEQAVARKKASRGDMVAICTCGSRSIKIGETLDNNYKPNQS